MDNFSLKCPNDCGLSAIATTAFCTVLLVTSAGRLRRSFASICLVHDIPKTEQGGREEVARRRSVKYEKSSMDLHDRKHFPTIQKQDPTHAPRQITP